MASGWVTPTEAGVLACVYALLVGMLERTITVRGVIGALIETAEASELILFIIAASSALSYVFVSEGTSSEPGYDLTSFDPEHRIQGRYVISDEGALFAIRPDGYIGVKATQGETDATARYFEKVVSR